MQAWDEHTAIVLFLVGFIAILAIDHWFTRVRHNKLVERLTKQVQEMALQMAVMGKAETQSDSLRGLAALRQSTTPPGFTRVNSPNPSRVRDPKETKRGKIDTDVVIKAGIR